MEKCRGSLASGLRWKCLSPFAGLTPQGPSLRGQGHTPGKPPLLLLVPLPRPPLGSRCSAPARLTVPAHPEAVSCPPADPGPCHLSRHPLPVPAEPGPSPCASNASCHQDLAGLARPSPGRILFDWAACEHLTPLEGDVSGARGLGPTEDHPRITRKRPPGHAPNTGQAVLTALQEVALQGHV